LNKTLTTAIWHSVTSACLQAITAEEIPMVLPPGTRVFCRVLVVASLVASVCALAPASAGANPVMGGGTRAHTYTLAMSMILSGQLRPLGLSIKEGAQLAVMQRDRTLESSGIDIAFWALDDGVGGVYSGPKDAQNARRFIANPTVFAEDGPYNSGASAVSMPVYNRGGLAQVSPGNTLPDLTDPRFQSRYEPATVAGKRGITYFRVCTTDAFQGPAGADFARTRFHPSTGYIVNDQGLPGIGLADAYARSVPKTGVKVLGRGALTAAGPDFGSAAVVDAIARLKPDVVYYGGDPETGGSAFTDLLRSRGLNMPVIGGDALLTPTFIVGSNGSFHPGSQNTWITAIGPNAELDPVDRAFLRAYRAQFHQDPSSFSVLAYDAANLEIDALLAALKQGATQSTAVLREAVRANIANTPYRGLGGAGRFDSNGDTTNTVISIWRVSGRTGKSFHWLGYAPGFAPKKG
jgi:branched-chain amino acid transport system substrate-binding protein